MHAENIIQLAENPATLLAAWQQLQTEHKVAKDGFGPLRARDAAKQLGVSEAQLIASRCGQGVTRLKVDWHELIKRLPELGYIMSLVRNESIVHERKGEYAHITFEGPGEKIGVVANDSIELRIFLYRWDSIFAVSDALPEGKTRLSLQIFDKNGTAIQKIFLTDQSNKAAYEQLVKDYKDTNQNPLHLVEAINIPAPLLSDNEIDVKGLKEEWANLKDTHDFYHLLRKFKVGREQALRLGGSEWAQEVDINSTQTILEHAAQTDLPLMVFVGNGNILQIHTGEIKNTKLIPGWFNILDKEFNLHLRQDQVAHAWIVRKPTVDGIVTSLELYDKAQELIVTFFGKRKPGIPEDLTWRALAESLVK